MPVRFVRSERPFTVSVQGATFKLQRPSHEKRLQLFHAAKVAGDPGIAFSYALLEESIVTWDGVFDIIADKLIPFDRGAVRDLPLSVTSHLLASLSEGEHAMPNKGNT
jgi:hypothetical protein